jgi:hypothetical protein
VGKEANFPETVGELPHLVGGGADQPELAMELLSCFLAKTAKYLTTLDNLVVSYHRPQLQPTLWAEGTNFCSQVSLLVEITSEITPPSHGLSDQGKQD